MAWSTRELADMAGATVNTIRHYHRLGLLGEPERRYNGYKQYGVPHLVRLLCIRRLVELGVPLSQIDEMGAGAERLPDVLRELDGKHAARIERLQQARAGIAEILNTGAPVDAPAGFESVAAHLSEAERSMLHIWSQLYDDQAIADLRRMAEVDAEAGAAGDEINALPADADEATRQRLAERLAPALVRNLIDYPWLNDARTRLTKSEQVTRGTVIEAMAELYNPAQLDVFARAGAIARSRRPVTAGAHP
jgi:DNA-binding transcriptional MerR regulator